VLPLALPEGSSPDKLLRSRAEAIFDQSYPDLNREHETKDLDGVSVPVHVLLTIRVSPGTYHIVLKV
jgi:hypothetical protein